MPLSRWREAGNWRNITSMWQSIENDLRSSRVMGRRPHRCLCHTNQLGVQAGQRFCTSARLLGQHRHHPRRSRKRRRHEPSTHYLARRRCWLQTRRMPNHMSLEQPPPWGCVDTQGTHCCSRRRKCRVHLQRMEPGVLPQPGKGVPQPSLYQTPPHHHCCRITRSGFRSMLHSHHSAEHGLGTPERPR